MIIACGACGGVLEAAGVFVVSLLGLPVLGMLRLWLRRWAR